MFKFSLNTFEQDFLSINSTKIGYTFELGRWFMNLSPVFVVLFLGVDGRSYKSLYRRGGQYYSTSILTFSAP